MTAAQIDMRSPIVDQGDASPVATCSSVERVAACPVSCALPQIVRLPSAAARGGIALHSYLERCQDGDPAAALAGVAEAHDRRAFAAIDLAALPLGGGLAAEVALLYDSAADTGRVLGRLPEARGYATALGRCLEWYELPGTADVVGGDEMTGRGLVIDYKRGWASHVPPAATSWQLRSLALALARAHDLTSVTVAIVRVLSSGEALWDVAELDAMDLEATAGELQAILARGAEVRRFVRAGEKPQPVAGDHCRYCPSFELCPAQTAMIRRVTADPEVPWLAGTEQPHPDAMVTAYRFWRAAKRAVDRLEERIRELARHTPLEIDGKIFGEVASERRGYAATSTHAILAERYGAAVADAAVPRSTTWTAIEEAVGGVCAAEGRKLAPELRTLRRELASAERRSVSTEVRLCTPKQWEAGRRLLMVQQGAEERQLTEQLEASVEVEE